MNLLQEPTVHVTHRLILDEIRDWSAQILEKPNSEFNGLPPCPFAKKAWVKEKVRTHIIYNLSECDQIKNQCPDDDSVDVVAWLKFSNITAKNFDKWLDSQNEKHNGIWTVGFHPDHPVDERQNVFEGNGSPEYGLILIQSLRHLNKSSKQILRKGYYKNYSLEDYKHIKKRIDYEG